MELDGHRFREVASATIAGTTGRGRNVIPDEYDVNVNYRFAPPRKPEEVFSELSSWVGEAATVEQFVQCFADVSGRDFSQFILWYTQAGTPDIMVAPSHDARAK